MDRLTNARYPDASSFYHEQEMISDFRAPIDQFPTHHHTHRCRKSNDKCKYGYPHPLIAHNRIQEFRYLFALSDDDQNIVPRKLDLLALFRCHHCLELIHSHQCIGYILKYLSKNSDIHRIGTLIYEGRYVSKKQQLEYYAALRVCSAVECFAQICGYRRHDFSQSVGLLPFYLENKRIVLTHPNSDAEERLN
jgi:hypothetical protein